MTGVVLTAAMNANLLSLQNTQSLLDQTQLRLSTGLKVNSALDNPGSFFAAQSLNNRASDLSGLLDSMGQAVQTVQAANNGITAITNFLQQALALAKQALSNANAHTNVNSNAAANTTTLQGITSQITQLATDSNYQGISLLKSGSSLKVNFSSTNNSSTLTMSGVDSTANGLAGSVVTAAAGGTALDTTAHISATITALNTAITTVRNTATGFSNDLSIIQNRQTFTQNLINTLQAGANDLTVADKNAEGAKLLALQTTQQLGITSLSLASQANQSILRLFP